MAQPRAFSQTNTFNDWTTTNPSDPHIGSKFDTEFTELKQNTDDLNTNIALIQRDDGKIKNEAIHKDAFDQDALALIGASGNGFTPKGDWTATTAYVAGDIVNNNDATYLTATTSHTSGSTFAGDSTYWTLIANSAISTSNASVDTHTATSGQTVFTTTYTYSNTKDIQVYQNGVLTATTLYSISNASGNNITFNTAPATGTVVIIWGDSVVSQQAKAATLGYRDTANNHKTTASRWAYHTGSVVTDAETSSASTEYSAKEYAIGTTVAVGSAKDWAVLPENSAVTGTSYSALHYAAKAAADLLLTNADVVSTNADVVSTNADVVSTNADVVTVEGIYDQFDDRFLGPHTTAQREVGAANIGLDHDGIALVAGAMYFDTTLTIMKVWSGTAWQRMQPTTAEQTNIDAAVADAVDIGKVAAKDAEIGRLGAAAYSDGANAYLALLGTPAMANSTDGDIKVVADNIADVNNFAVRYRTGDSDPTTSLDDGDLFWNRTSDELKIYNTTASAWQVPYLDSASVNAEATNAAISMAIALG